jgi:hypothetical protein
MFANQLSNGDKFIRTGWPHDVSGTILLKTDEVPVNNRDDEEDEEVCARSITDGSRIILPAMAEVRKVVL